MQYHSVHYPNMSDEQLLCLAREGDSFAADELVSRIYPTVAYLVDKIAYFGIEKSDLIQEGMIGVIAAIHSFDRTADVKFKTYAKSCILNQLNSTIRRLYQKKQIPREKLVSINKVFIQDTVKSPEEAFIERENISELITRLEAKLSAFEMDILKKYLSGYSAAEIAGQLGISVKRVSNALYRVRQKFHSLIP